jgi:hypothetical protein
MVEEQRLVDENNKIVICEKYKVVNNLQINMT